MERQPLFLLHLVNGYTLRNVMKIIKSEVPQTSLILSPKSIEVSFMNTGKTAVHGIVINPDQCNGWIYNFKNEDGSSVDEYPIGFDTTDFYNTTKKIGRRDGIRIFLMPGDNKLTVQPIKSAAKDVGSSEFLFVPILQIEHLRYTIGRYSNLPNVKISPNNFGDMCGNVTSLQCKILEISGHNSAIEFRGIDGNKKEVYYRKFGSATNENKMALAPNIDEITDIIKNYSLSPSGTASNSPLGLSLNVVDSRIVCISVPIGTINSLSKIDNISPTGSVLKFYFEEQTHVKLESSIGTYGIYTILFMNSG